MFVQQKIDETTIFMKTRRTAKFVSNVPKHVIILLCTLLFTGCTGNDFSTSDSDKDKPSDHGRGTKVSNAEVRHGTKIREEFRQELAHRPRRGERVYRHEQHSVLHNQIPGYRTESDANDWQGIYHNYDWSDVDMEPLRSTPTAQTIRGKPYNMSQEVFREGCKVCYEDDAYETRGAVQCTHCKRFVCQACYEKISAASETPTTSDYRAPMSTGNYRLGKTCPFCRKSF
jgi:hypothetical protein